jgi:hypothetical protein
VRNFRADLHVHTVLSPCAEVEMIPPLIVDEALRREILLIAITDHNSSANVQAVQKAADQSGLHVLPGMEIQTREDIHSLCLFDTLEQLRELQHIVDNTLPTMKNQPEHLGEQFIVNETGDFIRREDRLLIASSSLSINEAFALVTGLGGLFIPAHVNRKTFGLIESLGFIPPGIPFPAVEISRHLSCVQARKTLPGIGDIPIIQNGDVHRLSDFLGSLHLQLEAPTILEITMAFKRLEGRDYFVV